MSGSDSGRMRAVRQKPRRKPGLESNRDGAGIGLSGVSDNTVCRKDYGEFPLIANCASFGVEASVSVELVVP
jgi:hypothetical protein